MTEVQGQPADIPTEPADESDLRLAQDRANSVISAEQTPPAGAEAPADGDPAYVHVTSDWVGSDANPIVALDSDGSQHVAGTATEPLADGEYPSDRVKSAKAAGIDPAGASGTFNATDAAEAAAGNRAHPDGAPAADPAEYQTREADTFGIEAK